MPASDDKIKEIRENTKTDTILFDILSFTKGGWPGSQKQMTLGQKVLFPD